MQRTIHHLTLDVTTTLDDYRQRIETVGRESKVRTVSLGTGILPQSPGAVSPTAAPQPTPVAPVPKRSEQHFSKVEGNLDLDALLDELDNNTL
jgi:hypothetical protein